jgi:hypothetical protein
VALKSRWTLNLYGDRTASGEALQRHFFDRSAAQSETEACIVNDASATDEDSMVKVAQARCDEVSSQGKLIGECDFTNLRMPQ